MNLSTALDIAGKHLSRISQIQRYLQKIGVIVKIAEKTKALAYVPPLASVLDRLPADPDRKGRL